MKIYNDIKIGVYAIAAGEPNEFIDRWLNSMKGADYIWVLVTRKGDANFAYFKEKQKLPEFKDKLFVEEKNINPFRFDVARNESLKLVDKDCDVLVCTDIDEVMIADFWDDLRKEVAEHPDFYRIYYKFCWCHDEQTDEPITVYWYDKIHHPKGYEWRYPAHEVVVPTNAEELGYHGKYFLDENKIYLHHYPKRAKPSRDKYLELLKLRCEENGYEPYSWYYLAREQVFYNRPLESLKAAQTLYNLLKMPEQLPPVAKVKDPLLLTATCIMIARNYIRLGILDEAEAYLVKAINANPEVLDSYILLAQHYAYTGRSELARRVLIDAKKNAKPMIDWRLCQFYWKEWKWLQIQAAALTWENKYKEAYDLLKQAESTLKSDDEKGLAASEQFFVDLEFVENKLKNIDKGVSYEK